MAEEDVVKGAPDLSEAPMKDVLAALVEQAITSPHEWFSMSLQLGTGHQYRPTAQSAYAKIGRMLAEAKEKDGRLYVRYRGFDG